MPKIKLICFDLDLTLVDDHYHYELNQNGLVPLLITGISPVVIINGKFVSELFSLEECAAHASAQKNSLYDREGIVRYATKLLEGEGTGIKNLKLIKNLMDDLLRQNINIAVTTFSDYPEVVPLVLKKIGLSDAVIEKTLIIYRCSKSKNLHLQKATNYFNLQKSELLLVDDDYDNVAAAIGEGYNSVHVLPDSTSYIDNIYEMVLAGDN